MQTVSGLYVNKDSSVPRKLKYFEIPIMFHTGNCPNYYCLVTIKMTTGSHSGCVRGKQLLCIHIPRDAKDIQASLLSGPQLFVSSVLVKTKLGNCLKGIEKFDKQV